MRKIIVFDMVTVDGYFCGPGGEIDWHNTDAEFNDFAIQQLKDEVGTIMFGKITYDMMAKYWTSGTALTDDPIVAEAMNNSPKIVFSKTMTEAKWKNTAIIKEETTEEIEKLKAQDGKDLFIFGSGYVVQAIANLGLIDEYRLMVNPIILGKGKSLFDDVEKTKLKLIKTREFKNGNILLTYQPSGAGVKQ